MIRQTAKTIRELEDAANHALLQRGDKKIHRDNMLEKCELLADLKDQAAPFLSGDDPMTAKLRAGLDRFASRANMALDVESIFFMSALLYPTHYKEGDKNDLERFVAQFDTLG